MSLQATCPDCGQHYTMPERLAGKTVKCKICAKRFALPAVEPKPEPEMEPAAVGPDPNELYGLADDGAAETDDEATVPLPPRSAAPGSETEAVGYRATPPAKSTSKKRKSTGASAGPLRYLIWLGAGLGAGLVGAAVWTAVGYDLQLEIGWLAWGIGLLAGVGVRAAAKGEQGVMSGTIAVCAAILSVLLGKFIVAALLVNDEVEQAGMDDPTFWIIRDTAHDIAFEWQAQGELLNWPPGKSLDNAVLQADYPPEVWSAAVELWNELPEPEKQQ